MSTYSSEWFIKIVSYKHNITDIVIRLWLLFYTVRCILKEPQVSHKNIYLLLSKGKLIFYSDVKSKQGILRTNMILNWWLWEYTAFAPPFYIFIFVLI